MIFTLGPKGTHANQAAISYFPDSSLQFLGTIDDIFEQVSKNKNSYGVVPLENMIEGSVRTTLDLLYETDLKIFDAITIPIHHNLLSKSADFEVILSHSQALAQCKKFLRTNYKEKRLQSVNSTADAAKQASEHPHCAAIASKFAGNIYGLKCIGSDIEDFENNETRFAIIHHRINSKPYKKTSLAITPKSDEPGLLIKLLYPFQDNNINLVKLESRPEKSTMDKYIFFIDIEADHRQARMMNIIRYLEKDLKLCSVKILGGEI